MLILFKNFEGSYENVSSLRFPYKLNYVIFYLYVTRPSQNICAFFNEYHNNSPNKFPHFIPGYLSRSFNRQICSKTPFCFSLKASEDKLKAAEIKNPKR